MVRKKNSIIRVIVLCTGIIVLTMSMVFANGQKETAATISFAGSGGYPPFNYLTDSGDVVGFDVDVAQEIANRLGLVLEYKTTAWDGIIEGLRAKRYDGILGSMGITKARAQVVDFSIPYYISGPQLIVRKDSGILGPESLGPQSRIGLVTGTTYEQDAMDLGVQAKLYEDDNQTLLELLNGRVDGVLTDRIVGLGAIAKLHGGDTLMLAGPVLRTEKMGIAFHQDSDILRQQVDQILLDMQADGTFAEISGKWFMGEDITKE